MNDNGTILDGTGWVDTDAVDTMTVNDRHIYNHNDQTPRINVSVEKNTKGHNWTATVVNAPNVETAMELLKQVTDSLQRVYGQPTV